MLLLLNQKTYGTLKITVNILYQNVAASSELLLWIVGLAHLGAMCTSKSVSIVEIQDFSKATVATHELGHR